MPPTQEIATLAPGLFFWHNYDSAVKADLSSSAIETEAGLFLIDPIPLTKEACAPLSKAAGIVVTNANHARATAEFREAFSIPVFVHKELCCTPDFADAAGVTDGAAIAPDFAAITIDGAAPGEIVLHSERSHGGIIVGDALINFEPHGFSFLPAKYCSNAKEMRRSLRKLLDYSFDWMLFAHGTPILKGARARLERLLESSVAGSP